MHAGEFLRLSGRLARLGAPPSTGRHLREAIEADLVIATGVTAADTPVDATVHPLAAGVHRKTITNLITWPLTAQLPQHLHPFATAARRRGPAADSPVLRPDDRLRFLDHLLMTAQRSTRPADALLRRQAVYLLGFDPRPHVVDWLRREEQRASRRAPTPGDLTGLLEARSASVALASAGDPSRLYDFVEHTTDSRSELANLNYWAYWIGEYPDEQIDDTFMLDDNRPWVGQRLLAHLVQRLEPDAAHLPLNLHTLHALIAARPSLLTGRPAARTPIATALDRLADVEDRPRSVREQIAGLQYALRIAAH